MTDHINTQISNKQHAHRRPSSIQEFEMASSNSTHSNNSTSNNKDRFIDLAQAALEEADIEEDRKGVIHEVMEALIAKTGAPLVAEVISEQLRSQDVIERIAENHERDVLKRRLVPRVDSTDSVESLKEPEDEILETQPILDSDTSDRPDTLSLFAEYLWRFFRVLILSSLVGLVYHYVK